MTDRRQILDLLQQVADELDPDLPAETAVNKIEEAVAGRIPVGILSVDQLPAAEQSDIGVPPQLRRLLPMGGLRFNWAPRDYQKAERDLASTSVFRRRAAARHVGSWWPRTGVSNLLARALDDSDLYVAAAGVLSLVLHGEATEQVLLEVARRTAGKRPLAAEHYEHEAAEIVCLAIALSPVASRHEARSLADHILVNLRTTVDAGELDAIALLNRHPD
jgi:hypothetical protein